MSIENITTLIASKKEEFSVQKNDKLLEEAINKKSEFIISGGSFVVAMILTILFCITITISSISLLNYIPVSLFLIIPCLFISGFLSERGLFAYNKHLISKLLRTDSCFKDKFYEENMLPSFLKQEIDSEMADALKLNLSLDQYKALKFQSSSNISYGDVYKFIANIDNTNQTLKEIEAEKYSVEYDNIKKRNPAYLIKRHNNEY